MRNKFFIEIGVSNFETLHGLLSQGWYGLMVEPLEDMFHSILEHPNLIKEKVALDTQDGFADFLVVKNPEIYTDPQGVLGMSSLVSSTGPLHDEMYNDKLKKIQVQTMRLDTLVTKHRIENIDLLKIDIEGKDVEVLLDYSFKIKPTFIKFEHIHYSGTEYDASVAGFDQDTMTQKYNQLLDRLREMGYMCWQEYSDVYCIR